MKACIRLGAAALALLALPHPALAGSTLNFPHLSFESGTLTGLAIVNPTGADAVVTLTAYGEDGTPLEAPGLANPVMIEVPANQQYAQVTSAIFNPGAPPETIAWLQATSPVDDLTGFFLFLNASVDFFDGADLPLEARRIVFNDVRFGEGFSTEVNLINPSTSQAAVELRLVTPAATFTGNLSLPPRGLARLDVADFFADAQPAGLSSGSGHLIADSSTDIAGFEFVRGEGDLLGLNARPAAELLDTLFFPQLAVLDPFQTELVIVNYSDETVILTITAHQENGEPFDATRLETNPVNRVLEAGRSLRADVAELFGFFGEQTLEGWLRVESSSRAINGSISYSIPGLNSVAAVASVGQGSTRAIFSHLATSLGFFTGVALLNSGSVGANVRIVALEPGGTPIGTFTTTLLPGQRVSDLITEFVPEAADRAGGLIWISSDVPIFLTSLFGSLSSGVLANIPAQPVPAGYRPDQGQPRLQVAPPLAILQPGAIQQFALLGGPGQADWSVNGIPGGDGQVGTVSDSGALTAPAEIPGSLPVVVTAQAGNQTAGASVDLISREVVVSGLGTVQSVAYLSGLGRMFAAETSLVGPARAPQQGVDSTVVDVTGGDRQEVAAFAGEDIPKMVPFTGVDQREYLLLAARSSGRILRLDPADGGATTVASGLNDPRAIVIDPVAGGLLVAEANRLSSVSALALNQGLVAAPRDGGPRLSQGRIFEGVSAAGIGVDRCSSDIYVTDEEAGEVLVIDRQSGAAGRLAGALSEPGQLAAVYRQGVPCPFFQLLVADRGADRVIHFTPVLSSSGLFVRSPGVRDAVALPAGHPLGGGAGVLLAELEDGAGQVARLEHPLLEADATNPSAVSDPPEPQPAGVSYLPVVADGQEAGLEPVRFETTLTFYNPGESTSMATIDLLGEAGDPLVLEFDEEPQTSLAVETQPGELVRATTTDAEGPRDIGYGRLTVDQGTLLVESILRFEDVSGEIGSNCELSMAPQPPTSDPLRHTFAVPPEGDGGEGSVALVLVVLNPEQTQSAGVRARLLDGPEVAGTEEFLLEPGQWRMFSAQQGDLFPEVTIASGSGTLTVEADRPIVSALLLLDSCPAGRVVTPATP